MLIIGARDVQRLLPMADCIKAIDQAMRAFSDKRVQAPVRMALSLADDGHFFLMPGVMEDGPVYGAKILNLLPNNPARGLPNVQGFVVLFDAQNGALLALVDGTAITNIRTAAASALATRELARPNAASHGIFGAGQLAVTHLRAVAAVRPLRETLIWARDASKARQFVAQAREETGLNIRATEQREEAASCDIVTLVTNAPEPVLFGRWLSPGAHLNLVGAHRPDQREADSEAVYGSRVFVDSLAGAMDESGDLLIPIREGRITPEHIRGEIGEVLNGQVQGRTDETQVTLYKSLGLVAQDLYAAHMVYRRALAQGGCKEASLD